MKVNSLLIVSIIISSLVLPLNAEKIDVDDVYLSTGLLHNKINDVSGFAFDTALSIPINVNFKEQNLSIEALFAVGVGSSRLGLPGSELVVNDLLIHKQVSSKLRVSAGSFDMPLGLVTDTLSNNADFTGSVFILNPIYMDALVGAPIGTLNTVGLKGFWQYDLAAPSTSSNGLTVSVSNGTNETAYNNDNKLAFAVSSPLGIGQYFHKDLSLQLTGFYSNDASDKQDSLGLKMSGLMLETNWDLTTDLKTVVGFGQTWFSKGSHDVSVDVGYAALTKKQQDWSYGLRLSIWNPKGYSKNRLDLPKPLFFNAEEPVQEFTRIQASLRYDLNLTQFVSCELAYDRASKTDDVTTTGCFYTVQVF